MATALAGQTRKLFLVAGQSNAVGVGNADSSIKCIPGTCFEYVSVTDSLRPLKDPVGYAAPAEDFMAAITGSAWPSFAYTYNALTGDTIIIAQAAKGATACDAAADVGAGNWSSSYHLFQQAVTKTKMAETKTGLSVSGIIWLQGESDALGIYGNKLSVCQYEDALKDLIQRFRDAFRCNLPFYIIQTGLYLPVYDSAFCITRQAQQQVAMEYPLTFIVDSGTINYRASGLMNADQIHYNQQALNTTGANAAQSIYYIEQHANLDSCYPVPTAAPAATLEVFPTLFTDELMVQVHNCNCAYISLQVTDMQGRTVYQVKQNMLTITQPVFHIPTAVLSKGNYVVRAVLNNQFKLTKKVVKD